MIIYFAGNGGIQRERLLIKHNTNRLVSYFYPNQLIQLMEERNEDISCLSGTSTSSGKDDEM